MSLAYQNPLGGNGSRVRSPYQVSHCVASFLLSWDQH